MPKGRPYCTVIVPDIPGWIVQEYVIFPGVLSVTVADAPGAMRPVANDLLSAVASCVVVSLLTHITLVPTGTVNGFGLNAVVVRANAPGTMETVVPDAAPPLSVWPLEDPPPGDGAVELPLHPSDAAAMARMQAYVRMNLKALCMRSAVQDRRQRTKSQKHTERPMPRRRKSCHDLPAAEASGKSP